MRELFLAYNLRPSIKVRTFIGGGKDFDMNIYVETSNPGFASFTYQSHQSRIVFGPGRIAALADEMKSARRQRALLLSTPGRRLEANRLAVKLKGLAVAVFAEAVMHTPVEVTAKAIRVYQECGADCVISVGGGSTIGLGKAIAYRNDALQIVVPTTYSGSEVTPILGQTENGIKTTARDVSVLPEIVIYDPELTVELPPAISATSGLNAIAHAVEGLYAKDRNPLSSLMAAEGAKAMIEALPNIVRDPENRQARTRALQGSWLCGTVLGTVGMALHHKLCHTLGGSFGLPHAETHAILIPHTASYNYPAAQNEMAPLDALFGGPPGPGLWDFARDIGAPIALRDIGMYERDLDKAADIAARNPYWNPRPVERTEIRQLLQHAWEGIRCES